MSRDENSQVRYAVASNAAVSLDSLAHLLVDQYAHIRVAAVTNPSLPPKAAARRIWIDPTPSVHVALASRVDLRPRALSWLERYSRGDDPQTYAAVRWRLRQNPACPDYLKKRLDYIDSRIAAHQATKPAWFHRLEVVVGLPVAVCGFPFAVLFFFAAIGDANVSDISGALIRGVTAVAVGWLSVFIVQRLWRRHAPPTGAYFVPPRKKQAMVLIAMFGFAIPIFALAGFAVGNVDAGPFVPIVWAIWVIALIAHNRLYRRRWPQVRPVTQRS